MSPGESSNRCCGKYQATPAKGVLMGTVVTSIIQSSSATTIMMVGFVNAGIMQVFQAIGVIMGANIGTSITGWILCLSYLGSDKSGLIQLFSTATLTAIVAPSASLFGCWVKDPPADMWATSCLVLRFYFSVCRS